MEADQPVLSAAASHFFEKRHGKRFRPTIVMLIAKAAAGTLENTGTEAYTKQAQLGQITEMIHVARCTCRIYFNSTLSSKPLTSKDN